MLAGSIFEFAQVLCDALHQALGHLPGLHVRAASLGGDRKPRRYGQAEVAHLGQAGAFAAKEILHLLRALGEPVHELVLVSHRTTPFSGLTRAQCLEAQVEGPYKMSMSMPALVTAAAPSPAGGSATTTSVVTTRAPMEAAFWRAERTTIAGSVIPAETRSSYSPVRALNPTSSCRFLTLSATMDPSAPAFTAICLIGSSSAR